jgi:hypothetical protein
MRRVSEWQFAQSFGTEESEEYGFSEDDIFTAVGMWARMRALPRRRATSRPRELILAVSHSV